MNLSLEIMCNFTLKDLITYGVSRFPKEFSLSRTGSALALGMVSEGEYTG